MKMITDITIEEQYTPQGTQIVLNVEDVDLDELLKEKITKIRPWDLYVAAILTRNGIGISMAIEWANAVMRERKKRYPQDDE